MFRVRHKSNVGAVFRFWVKVLVRFRAMAIVRAWFKSKPRAVGRTIVD
jgi:hypothetical protein